MGLKKRVLFPQGKGPPAEGTESSRVSQFSVVRMYCRTRTTPVEVFVRRRLRELAAVLLHDVVLVRQVLGLDLTDPENAGRDYSQVKQAQR